MAGPGREPRAAPMAQEEGTQDSIASASHKMTQFKQAFTGKTHTQELPDWLFSQPAALTLYSQQGQQ